MTQITFNDGEFILHNASKKTCSLVNIGNPAANRSDLLQNDLIVEVNDTFQRLFDQTPAGAVNAIIYLRLVNGLMRKVQICNVLHVGSWSPLDGALTNTLPKFNAKNFLWSYVPVRPVGQFANVNFIFVKVHGGGEIIVPENKFDAVIFSEQTLPPTELLLASKDGGKIFFVASKESLPDFWTTAAQTFDLEQNFSVVELELSPSLKDELRRRSPQGQLDDKKSQIRQTVLKVRDVMKKINTLPPQEQNACLDEHIAEVARAEKVLNEIFLELRSDTIKLNLNMLKEFLIDFRLYDDEQMKSRAAEDLDRQIGVLLQDLNTL